MTRIVETKIVSGEAPEGVTVLDVIRPYSMRITGQLIPKRFDIRWERVNDGEWQLIRLTASGPKLKKNGEAGMAEGTTSYYEWGRQWGVVVPDWLLAQLDRYQP